MVTLWPARFAPDFGETLEAIYRAADLLPAAEGRPVELDAEWLVDGWVYEDGARRCRWFLVPARAARSGERPWVRVAPRRVAAFETRAWVDRLAALEDRFNVLFERHHRTRVEPLIAQAREEHGDDELPQQIFSHQVVAPDDALMAPGWRHYTVEPFRGRWSIGSTTRDPRGSPAPSALGTAIHHVFAYGDSLRRRHCVVARLLDVTVRLAVERGLGDRERDRLGLWRDDTFFRVVANGRTRLYAARAGGLQRVVSRVVDVPFVER